MEKKMKGYKTGKIGETTFTAGTTPYANDKAYYGKKRADKIAKKGK